MEPAAAEGVGRGLGILEISEHHVVAPQHDFAQRCAVGGDIVHVQVHDARRLGLQHPHPLAGDLDGPVLGGKIIPLGLVLADGVGPVDLRQPINVDHADPDGLQGGDDCGRRRRARRRDPQRGLQLVGLGRVGNDAAHRGGAAEVGDAESVDGVPDGVRAHSAQADVNARHRRHGPSGAPAVAVEHRKRPEVARGAGELIVDGLPERVQVRPAVRVQHALGLAGGAGGVVKGDGGAFVLDTPRKISVPASRCGEEVGILRRGHARRDLWIADGAVRHFDDLQQLRQVQVESGHGAQQLGIGKQ